MQHLNATTENAYKLLPELIRKPAVILRWLLTAKWAYIAIVLVAILMSSLIPSAVDAALAKLYPPIRTKRMFGLLVNQTEDPRIATRHKLIMGILWAGACGMTFYVLFLGIPRAARRAEELARMDEKRADALSAIRPSESIMLYNSAIKLATDPVYESTLKSKIDLLDQALKDNKADPIQVADDLKFPPPANGTILLHQDESRQPSDHVIAIGPEGRYRIADKLGQGAMGIVYRGKDQILLRDVALKKLPASLSQDQDIVTRFQQEARALARLSHPNIVQIYDFVRNNDEYWIAMEYVEGHDLDIHLKKERKFPFGEVVQLSLFMAAAMAEAHNKGVIHRDFKPSNVLLTSNGVPKITDFGLAKLAHSSVVTQAGLLMGSPAFMSPEQAQGSSTDARSDIYALGMTMLMLFTGKLPFEGDVKSIIARKIAGHRPSLPDFDQNVPDALIHLVEQMIAPEPKDRPESMDIVVQTLEGIRHNKS